MKGIRGARYPWSMSTTRGPQPSAPPVPAGSPQGGAAEPRAEREVSGLTEDERSQIDARLHLTPSERLRYLEDMVAFEEMSRRARRLT
jgi:hypothetical protein